MKHQFLTLLTICIAAWNYIPRPASADAPQPGSLQFAFTSNTVSLGEPLVLKYRITNSESRGVKVYMGKDERGWLSMSLKDASGHPMQAIPDPEAIRSGIHSSGVTLDQNGYHVGYVVVSQKFQPTQIGQYRLNLTSHLTYLWADGSDERYTEDQNYSLPVTVTARDPQRLHTVAEGLRWAVLNDKDVSQYRSAIKALLSMRGPECLSVWRELATDPNLDAFRAADVIHELANVQSVSASDILAAMQPIAPERWSQMGTAPLDVLQWMWHPATPAVKQHINQLLKEAGVPPVSEHTKLTGEAH